MSSCTFFALIEYYIERYMSCINAVHNNYDIYSDNIEVLIIWFLYYSSAIFVPITFYFQY